jgi:colicin import membrane protein
LDERRSYWCWAASSVLHGALLALILLGFAAAPKFEDSPKSISVETVTASELNQVMNGEKDARPAPDPPPAPQAISPPPAPPEAPTDLRASQEPSPTPPPPEPPQPPPPPKPAPPPPSRPLAQDVPEPPIRPKDSPPEKLKQDLMAKIVEREKTEPPKPTRAYDPNTIAKLIGQSKQPSSSTAANGAGATPQGLPHHDAPRMSMSMASALDAWLTESYLACWTPPPAMPEGDVYVAEIKVILNADGSLSARPVLLNPPTDPAWRAHAESAMRAVRKCDPLRVPPQYAPFFEEWKVETIHFDPRESQG